MKIVFATKALGNKGGGAERVMVQVASGMEQRGHEVVIITSDRTNADPYYPLSKNIRLIRLGIGDVSSESGVMDVLRRMSTMRNIIREMNPNVVVSFMHSSYLPTGVAMFGSSIPVIGSEHIGPEHYATRPGQRLALQLAPVICKRITVVSDQIRQSYGHWLRRRMIVVPNPVSVSKENAKPKQDWDDQRLLLSVGRLAPQKDQATLISAFGLISNRFPEWILRIVGEGELRGKLEEQVIDLGLTSRVELVGAKANVDAEYSVADIFVLPSIYESFGLATAEALLHGLPAIGFADCPGTNELICDGENGRLVTGSDRVVALSEVLAELMGSPSEIERLASGSRESIRNRFSIEGVLDSWESVILDAIS